LTKPYTLYMNFAHSCCNYS